MSLADKKAKFWKSKFNRNYDEYVEPDLMDLFSGRTATEDEPDIYWDESKPYIWGPEHARKPISQNPD